MKYEKCLDCKQLGVDCDGPNLLLLDAVELGHWCNELRKRRPGMTYDKTAAETGVSKTAVYNFLNSAHPDCRIETARPVAALYIGGNCLGNPCGSVTNSEKAAYEEKIRQLEKDLAWKDDKIRDLQENNASMKTLVTNTNARATQDKDFLRSQITNRNKAITALSICLGLCLLLIIGALIVDRINPDIGFIWLRSWFGGEENKIMHIANTIT